MKNILLVAAMLLAPAVHAASELEELIATVINAKGYLCANITRAHVEGEHRYRVICTEYRSGSGEVEYIVNMAEMSVAKIR